MRALEPPREHYFEGLAVSFSRPPHDRPTPAALGQLGMNVLFVSLSVLFVAAALAVVITRARIGEWRPPGSAGLPWAIFASTGLLAVVSGALHGARRAIGRNRITLALRWLKATLIGALGFLCSQALAVRTLTDAQGHTAAQSLFLFSFDLLVGLHAAHVIGGFVPLSVVYGKLARHEYSSSRHSGLVFCCQYWDYLGVVWLLLLAVLAWIV